MRCGALHLAEYRNFLSSFRYQQLIAVPQQNVAGAPGTTIDYFVHIDYQPADRLGITKLLNQLLADCKCLPRTRSAAATSIRNSAGAHGLERQRRQITLQAIA